MQQPKLSRRMELIAGLCRRGSVVADIGTDHAYLPIWLTRNGVSPFCYASDVAEGPLERARENIRRYGQERAVQTVLADGLKGIPPEQVDDLVIAGMGGRTVCGILDGWDPIQNPRYRLILQPQSEQFLVRRWLAEHGFELTGEWALLEDGKYYIAMTARYDGTVRRWADWRYELPVSLQGADAPAYLLAQRRSLEKRLAGDRMSGRDAGTTERILAELDEMLTAWEGR